MAAAGTSAVSLQSAVHSKEVTVTVSVAVLARVMKNSQLPLCALVSLLLYGVSALPNERSKQKRQIFREQVLPQSGGKIPEDAFRTDRLALNRLNKEGIAVPDGVLLEARHRESHHQGHRHDPVLSESIIRLVQHPDGRYTPPEGHYPSDQLIESTYIIRPSWGQAHALVVPPHRTQEVPLVIPNRAHPHAPPLLAPAPHDDFFTLNNHLEAFLDDDPPGTTIWSGFGRLFHEPPSRFLRQAAARGAMGNNAGGANNGQYPRLTEVPATSFSCGSRKGKMLPDPEANCQAFHLCHTTGQRETFLCPQGMRFHAGSNQCVHWSKVTCR